MLFCRDLLTGQNCCSSIGVGDIFNKVKSLLDLKNSALADEILTLQNDIEIKPRSISSHRLLESIQCSGNHWWWDSIPISEDVQLVCSTLLSRT